MGRVAWKAARFEGIKYIETLLSKIDKKELLKWTMRRSFKAHPDDNLVLSFRPGFHRGDAPE